MNAHQTTAESAAVIATKVAPPVTVSLATLGGYQVSELVLWATLIYTTLLIAHKLWSMWKDFRGKP